MSEIKEFLVYIKDLIFAYLKSRLFPLTITITVLFALLVNRLYTLQIKQGAQYSDDVSIRTEKTLTIPSIRGNIYDVNGKLLAYNIISYNLTFENDANQTVAAKERGVSENILKNQVISDTIDILSANGDSLDIDFVIKKKNGKYVFSGYDSQVHAFLRDVYAKNSYDELSKEEKASTPTDILAYLAREFEVSSEYDSEKAFQIIKCRYMLWLNRFQQYVPVEIATNISEKSRSAIIERQDKLPGIDITVESKRVYNDAKYFAHIIGYVGTASESDLEELNDGTGKVYDEDDVVGKTGIERVYEKQLHGGDGQETMYVDNLGKVTEIINSTSPVAGENIYLTIDSDLQKYCYDMLEKEIANILLAHIQNIAEVSETQRGHIIPITDVYSALFENNQISLEKMTMQSASVLEKNVYSVYRSGKSEALNRIREILTTDPVPVGTLDHRYQEYMEYICEFLADKDLYFRSRVDDDDSTFNKYVNGKLSIQEFLKYLISIEAIEVSEIEEKNRYYDSDEIYQMLAEYIMDEIEKDPNFDNMIIKTLIVEHAISGEDVVNLIYDQEILPREKDSDYDSFREGYFGAFEFMTRKIRSREISPAMLGLAPCSGAIVVTDVKTGKTKAMVSYPSYDNNYLTNSIDPDYYDKLLADSTAPLYDRACMMRTAPGSTFKIVSSVAGVSEGVLGIDEFIQDVGVFDKVYTQPQCWIYAYGSATHGLIDLPLAIDQSCNYFFYEVGYRLATKRKGEYIDADGIENLAKYAGMFGLDSKSGVEIDEISPHVSDNDAVTSAIGQGKNLYAPVQLARYATTIANSGTCYDLTLMDRITDYKGTVVKEGQAKVHNQMNISNELWDKIHTGMRLVVTDDLKSNKMLNSLNVDVAGKTGTAQENEYLPDHALFISYAPAESPEISVTTVIKNGYSSGNAAELSSFIYAYIFDKDMLTNNEVTGNYAVGD